MVLIGIASTIARARFFPPTIRVHVIAPGQFQINARDVKKEDLKHQLSKFKSDMNARFCLAEMQVVLPARRHETKSDSDISELATIGGEAGFERVAFARRSAD